MAPGALADSIVFGKKYYLPWLLGYTMFLPVFCPSLMFVSMTNIPECSSYICSTLALPTNIRLELNCLSMAKSLAF